MEIATCAQCRTEGLPDEPGTPCPRCGSTARVIATAGILEQREATIAAFGQSRHNFAVLHLASAASFSRRTRELEAKHAGEALGSFWEEIVAHASAATLLSVAALEAYVTESLFDHTDLFSSGDPHRVAARKRYARRMAPLERYKYALNELAQMTLDLGTPACQPVSALVELRNQLTHFRPEWLAEQADHAKLGQMLARWITPSPFILPSKELFPRGWASHSCTAWAVRSVVDFILEFDRRAGFESRLAQHLDRFTDI